MADSTPVAAPGSPGSGARGPGSSRLLLALALALLAAFALHARAWTFLCDDAYISFRYARNLAEYGMPVFNVSPPERVEGYTNFLWVLILAGGHVLGASPPALAPLLTWLASLISLPLVALLSRQIRGARRLEPADLLGPALLVFWPEFLVWSSGGLEGSFALALVLGAMVSWNRGALVWAAGLSAAATLTRPDAILPIAGYGVGWLVATAFAIRGQPRPAIPWRRVAVAAAVFLGPVLAHLLWRHAYYGSWSPNTWTIKAHGRLLRDTWGVAYVRTWAQALGVLYLLPLLVVARPKHAPLVLPLITVVGYAWWVGGDFMAYGRFLLVATALYATLLAVLISDGVTRLSARFSRRVSVAVGLLVAVGLMISSAVGMRLRWKSDMAKTSGWIDGRWEGVATMDRFARIRVAAGSWMRAHLPPDTLVTVGAAGAMPYASGLQTIDAFGLIDPEVARQPGVEPRTGKRARPGHQLIAPTAYLKSRDADLYCHVGWADERPPPAGKAAAGFRRGYGWACVEPTTVEDPRAPNGVLDTGYYCCRRPVDRVVGPFGAEGGP